MYQDCFLNHKATGPTGAREQRAEKMWGFFVKKIVAKATDLLDMRRSLW